MWEILLLVAILCYITKEKAPWETDWMRIFFWSLPVFGVLLALYFTYKNGLDVFLYDNSETIVPIAVYVLIIASITYMYFRKQ